TRVDTGGLITQPKDQCSPEPSSIPCQPAKPFTYMSFASMSIDSWTSLTGPLGALKSCTKPSRYATCPPLSCRTSSWSWLPHIPSVTPSLYHLVFSSQNTGLPGRLVRLDAFGSVAGGRAPVP